MYYFISWKLHLHMILNPSELLKRRHGLSAARFAAVVVINVDNIFGLFLIETFIGGGRVSCSNTAIRHGSFRHYVACLPGSRCNGQPGRIQCQSAGHGSIDVPVLGEKIVRACAQTVILTPNAMESWKSRNQEFFAIEGKGMRVLLQNEVEPLEKKIDGMSK